MTKATAPNSAASTAPAATAIMVISCVLGEDADGPAAAVDVKRASVGNPAGAIEGAPSVAEGDCPGSEGVTGSAAAGAAATAGPDAAPATASGPALEGVAAATEVLIGMGAAGA